MRIIAVFILLILSVQVKAQDDLFGQSKGESHKGVIFGFNAGLDLPGGDMAKRFGFDARAGINALYKSKSNWLIGAKFDYLFGNQIKEDSLMINIQDKYGSYINNNAQRIGVKIYERGYMFGLQAGRIFNIGKNSKENGILALTTVGFIEHKIFIRDRGETIPALKGDYVKGYDRLTNGLLLEQYLGYVYFSNNQLLNYTIGLNISAGFTRGRRDFLYDVMRPDNAKRLDLLFGIRAAWYIPIFKRKSEDYFFE